MGAEQKKWYALQTFCGSEGSVKIAIQNLIKECRLEDKIEEVLVPTEEVFYYKNKEKKELTQSIYKGYVFIKASLDNDLWHMIASLPRVGRFIGESGTPTPLSNEDIAKIQEKANTKSQPKPKVYYEAGEMIRVIDGPFANFTATVEEYDMQTRKLKLNISIFGRNTPVDMEDSQVEKII